MMTTITNSPDKTPSIVSINSNPDLNQKFLVSPPALTLTSSPSTTNTAALNQQKSVTSPALTITNGESSIGNSNNSATITVGTNNILNIQNAATDIQFTSGKSAAAFHNEMGVFIVDDAQGRVDGILPGKSGYLAAVMKRSQVIGGNVDGTSKIASSRQLSFADGVKLGFYLVQDGTTAEIKADLSAGKTPSHPVFFQAGNADGSEHLRITQSDGKYTFGWEDLVGGSDGSAVFKNTAFDDLVINARLVNTSAPWGAELQGSKPVVNLRDISGLQPASLTVGGSAAYDNFIGFYTVDDPSGKIGNLNPSDPGYALAAIDRRISNNSTSTSTIDIQLDGGKILAPYLVANGNVQDFLTNNPTNQGNNQVPHAYFGYIGANPDKIEHIRLLGDNQFAFEDMFGGGDRDFNDAIVHLKVIT
jgi:hypothetical protein